MGITLMVKTNFIYLKMNVVIQQLKKLQKSIGKKYDG